ncbi:2-oxoglutarate and iron-dependent oxygenase JMJD4 homolog [Drosophila guanche]|uniref:Jumonji domain-containing protein 4 n=1 Tax=Drosophila guanche TaxID=7266 RepID=A0A3B0JFN6_DROGU|nr:2-oxoglutarate and iron-dependent oxygenase JMJD4 homolog [Drosophila guanche]SPP79032.1 blast:JmjC domain-containing protein 4 homolog [Drosophila guanche]
MATERRAGAELLGLQPPPRDDGNKELFPAPPDTVQRRGAGELSYNEFYWQYMHHNWPVIITDVSSNWQCQQWTSSNGDDNANANDTTNTAHINFDYLRGRIGNCPVPVADCNATYFNSHAKVELNFHDYLSRWQGRIESAGEAEVNSNVARKTNDNLYLKDWHLAAQMPSYDFYKVPKYFASDWLNEQLMEQKRDDYRFVYMGPRDSWTSYHSDVFGSFSWSTNIVGHKKWLIMPPGEELKLSDRLGNLPFSINEQLLDEHKVHYFTINQKANEAVFVPSGWYHQVWNLTDTISINHNWFNACNVPLVWRNLLNNLKAVRREISDCQQMDNFEAHCQTMLRASFGINYLDFIELLEFISARRLAALADSSTTTKFLLFDTYKMCDFHVKCDLECLRKLLTLMLQDASVQQSPAQLLERCQRLLSQILV